jgi:hypothetical protein
MKLSSYCRYTVFRSGVKGCVTKICGRSSRDRKSQLINWFIPTVSREDGYEGDLLVEDCFAYP